MTGKHHNAASCGYEKESRGSHSNYGEVLRENGTLSAPPSAPPPGFDSNVSTSDHIRKRQDRVNQAAATLQKTYVSNVAESGKVVESVRTTSFVNLAEALGEGLAESMDDSCKEQTGHHDVGFRRYLNEQTEIPSMFYSSGIRSTPQYDKQIIEGGNPSMDNTPKECNSEVSTVHNRNGLSAPLDNFHRQSRHSASRMVGKSPVTESTSFSHQMGPGILSNKDTIINKGNSSQFGTAHLNIPVARGTPARIGMSVEEPCESGNSSKEKSSINLTEERSNFINKNSTGKPSSLAMAASLNPSLIHNSFPPVSVALQNHPQVDGKAILSNDHTLIRSTTQQMIGLDLSVEKNVSDSMLKSSVVSGLEGRSSAPPDFSQSRTDVTEQHLISQESSFISHLAHNSQRNRLSVNASPTYYSVGSRNTTPSPISTPEPCFSTAVNVQTNHSDNEHVEVELAPFLMETLVNNEKSLDPPSLSKPSRGITILGVSPMLLSGNITVAEIRTACEGYGTLESFRSDFARTKGVIFVTYFDLRSSQRAGVELCGYLSRLASSKAATQHLRSMEESIIKVKYCTPLHSSMSTDESLIFLFNLPKDMDEDELKLFMESYGEVKQIQYQMLPNTSEVDYETPPSYTVEFFDIQDAKHALLELLNTQPWGPHVKVQKGMRNPTSKRKAKELLTLIGRWRHGLGALSGTITPPSASTTPPPPSVINFDHSNQVNVMSQCSSRTTSTSPLPNSPGAPNGFISMLSSGVGGKGASGSVSYSSTNQYPASPSVHRNDEQCSSPLPAPHTQLVLLPDGRYSYVMVNPTHHPHSHHVRQPAHLHHLAPPVHHPQYVTSVPVQSHPGHPPDPRYVPHYWTSTTVPSSHSHTVPYQTTTHLVLPSGTTSSSYVDAGRSSPSGLSTYSAGSGGSMNLSSGIGNSNSIGSSSNTRHTSTTSGKKGNTSGPGSKNRQNGDNVDDARLALNITAVMNGTDTRTSLMVRNIPNKYTQQMLLSEFGEYGHGSDKIDFFYLPIDFKNRCNRGYAFVNFVQYRDIISFHERYNNKQWRVFNSDKVCAITYARIQGKAAMLKRFENSALLDKNDEYRPLVFTSHGVNKGMQESFPSTTNEKKAEQSD